MNIKLFIYYDFGKSFQFKDIRMPQRLKVTNKSMDTFHYCVMLSERACPHLLRLLEDLQVPPKKLKLSSRWSFKLLICTDIF